MRQLETYLQYLTFEKRYSQHTIESYHTDLKQFDNYLLEVYQTNEITELQDQMIRSWLADMMEQGFSAKTINRKVSSVKSFFKYLKRQGFIITNPAFKIQGPKQKKKLPVFVDQSKMETLLNRESNPDSFKEFRDLLIMELFYSTGIRRAELIELKIHDVHINKGQIKVLGKRNKERIIPIGDHLTPLVESYLIMRDQVTESIDAEIYFFLTENGKKLYPKLVYRVVNSYLSTVSTQDKKSPHVMRHTFATHMLNNGADLNAVKELLGHASLAATQIYTHNTIEKLKKIYQQAHPKA